MFKTPLPPRKSAIPTPPSTQAREPSHSVGDRLAQVKMEESFDEFSEDSFNTSDLSIDESALADGSPLPRKRPFDGPENTERNKLNHRSNKEQEKWPKDVEEAFEKALRIIPKQGLYKIKINGRACGRNELISDYILAKTGKVRSRKQVSSHIQVVKNLKKRPELTKLIVDGPPCDQETKRLFDQEFGQISMAKISAASKETSSAEIQTVRYPLAPVPAVSNIQPREIGLGDLFKIDLTLKKFVMNFVDFDKPAASQMFTSLPQDFTQPPLRIRTNADLSHRFPQLFELVDQIKQDTQAPQPIQMHSSLPPVPILHGMVKLIAPDESQEFLTGHFNVSSSLQLANLPLSDRKYACLTLIYSYGRIIVTTLEKLESKAVKRQVDHKEVTLDIRLGTNYWADFFASIRRLMKSPDTNHIHTDLLARAIKGITMKQVIVNVNNDNELVADTKPRISLDNVPKNNVRAILLWEFLRVQEPEEATTTVRRIHLPVKREAEQLDVLPVPVAVPETSDHSQDLDFPDALSDFQEHDPFLSLNTINPNEAPHLDENYSYLW
ncbi:hypothetical protein OGAPHI_000519 [Ogataea philodendri]|uniref:TEA domain-containing protein n=1 Tax=Ogataea philodendri TaxID=1378263 RepID=A0A9P8T9X5_9ASCO|nr:uncharacterized protein OGAPHI_000519 [Ogataea philodendri]KAH3671296.1 hypothetical protein OGAPHI_000519 [Ogataea philodendri]